MTSLVASNNEENVASHDNGSNSLIWNQMKNHGMVGHVGLDVPSPIIPDTKLNSVGELHATMNVSQTYSFTPDDMKIEAMQDDGIATKSLDKDGSKEGYKIEMFDAEYEVQAVNGNEEDILNDNFASIISLAKLVDGMDVDSVMQAIEAKILENFTSWDLIVRRARLYQLTSMEHNTIGIVQFLVSEIESLLGQISDVLAECMEPNVDKEDQQDTSLGCENEYVEISELFSASLGLVRGTWRRTKELESIPMKYRSLFDTADTDFYGTIEEKHKERKKKIPIRNKLRKNLKLEIVGDVKEATNPNVNGLIEMDMPTQLEYFSKQTGDINDLKTEFVSKMTLPKKKLVKIKRSAKLKDIDSKAKAIDYVKDIENYDVGKEYSLVCTVCGSPILNEVVMAKHKDYCNGMSQTRINYEQVSEHRFRCRMQECSLEPTKDGLSEPSNPLNVFEKESEVITHCYLTHYDKITRASVCQDCGMKFATPKHRVKHFARVHDKKYICSMCGKRFFREPLLADHMVTHTGEKPYKCDRESCSYASTSLGLLKKHLSRHDAGTLMLDSEDIETLDPSLNAYDNNFTKPKKTRVRKRRLPKCASLSRETKVALAKEEDGLEDIVIKAEQHEPGTKLPYFCDKCNHVYGRFATIQGLKTHMKFCTGSIKNKEHCLWTCDGGCMKEFFYLRSLKDHRPKCDGVKVLSAHWQRSPVNGEYMCGVPGCSTNETWQGMYGVRQHFFAEHVTEEDKVFKCDYCDAKFAYKTMKSEHMRKNHLKQHICSYCGRAFSEKHKLRDHQMMHTGEKPFACDQCEYRAAKKYNLDAHKLSKHGDSSGRSFFCETCGKSFLTKSNLRGHITVVHEGGRSINMNTGDTKRKL